MDQHSSGLEDRSGRNGCPPGETPPPDVSGVGDQWLATDARGQAAPPAATLPAEDAPPSRRLGLPLLLFMATCLSRWGTFS
jgi:hypothetical protein